MCYNTFMNTIAFKLHFGENLRKIRTHKGYSLAQLSEMSGISKRMLGHYETQVKRPSIDKIIRIAETLDASLDELIGLEKIKQKDTLSLKLIKKLRVIEQLPTRDQNMIFSLINSLVEKNKLKGNI